MFCEAVPHVCTSGSPLINVALLSLIELALAHSCIKAYSNNIFSPTMSNTWSLYLGLCCHTRIMNKNYLQLCPRMYTFITFRLYLIINGYGLPLNFTVLCLGANTRES